MKPIDRVTPPLPIREMGLYSAVGVLVFCADWLCFVVLSYAGLPVPMSNLAARGLGALLGFMIHRTHTFPGGASPSHHQLMRYAVVWLSTTSLGTLALWSLGPSGAQLDVTAAWLLKPIVDGALAVLGFLASKYWIYR